MKPATPHSRHPRAFQIFVNPSRQSAEIRLDFAEQSFLVLRAYSQLYLAQTRPEVNDGSHQIRERPFLRLFALP